MDCSEQLKKSKSAIDKRFQTKWRSWLDRAPPYNAKIQSNEGYMSFKKIKKTKKKPNVIICMCDQLRAFEVGCYGNQVIQTPNIDKLAKNGVRFEQAVTNNPVCMVARSSLLSGLHGRTCTGLINNFVKYDESGQWHIPDIPTDKRKQLLDPTLPERLKTLG